MSNDISTPIPKNLNAQIPFLEEWSEFSLNGVQFKYLFDKISATIKREGETNIDFKLINFNWNRTGKKIIQFTPFVILFTVQTVYKHASSRKTRSGYGRGTTQTDISAKHTSLVFHEGSHGLDYINFVRNNAPPQFLGKVGMPVPKFKQKINEFESKVELYFNRLKAYTIRTTDCVGRQKDDSGIKKAPALCFEH